MDQYPRTTVAADVGLLTFLFCLAGGAVVGGVGLPLSWVVKFGWDRDIAGAVLIGGAVGLGFGMVLGILGALVLGAFAAVALVPYRGARATRHIMGVTATIFVTLWWGLLYWALGVWPSGAVLWSMVVPSLAAGWLLGPVTARQFIARCEHPIEPEPAHP